ARLADPLPPFGLAAVVRRRRQAHQRPQFLTVLDGAPGEQLRDQGPGTAHPHRLQPHEPTHLPQVRLLPLAQTPLLLIGRVTRLPRGPAPAPSPAPAGRPSRPGPPAPPGSWHPPPPPGPTAPADP